MTDDNGTEFSEGEERDLSDFEKEYPPEQAEPEVFVTEKGK